MFTFEDDLNSSWRYTTRSNVVSLHRVPSAGVFRSGC